MGAAPSATVVRADAHMCGYIPGRGRSVLYEWGENQRAANIAKHGLDLAVAVAVFDGRPAISYSSVRFDEARTVTVGILASQFVAVVWTARGQAVRLISLRRARDAEKVADRARYGR